MFIPVIIMVVKLKNNMIVYVNPYYRSMTLIKIRRVILHIDKENVIFYVAPF